MGTFHDGMGELHGITVVVDTDGPLVYIGRCWKMDDRQIILVDVDQFEEGQESGTKQEFISKAARVGIWKKHDRLALPSSIVKSVMPLGEVLPT